MQATQSHKQKVHSLILPELRHLLDNGGACRGGRGLNAVAVLVVEDEPREVQRLTAPTFRDGPLPQRRVAGLTSTFDLFPHREASVAAAAARVHFVVIVLMLHSPRPILAKTVHGTHPHAS